jgi:hypothetical protein
MGQTIAVSWRFIRDSYVSASKSRMAQIQIEFQFAPATAVPGIYGQN